ncbi:MAG TPA: hypothetical protein VKE51_16380 [Vicinamibacterales bacterium]|nr:hypothetical protein [Vicinamibacterales bacterium]
MDADHRDQVTVAALDRELKTMLGVDPSPEFVARVRTRIADEPSPVSSWFGAWRIAASLVAVTAVAIVAAAVVVIREGAGNVTSPQPVLDSRPAALSGSPIPELTGRALRVSSEPTSGVPGVRTAAQHALATPQRAEPEILVDAREVAALRALIDGTRDGRIDLAPVLNAAKPSVMELPPVVDIDIPAITIEPIAPAPGEEGVRQ